MKDASKKTYDACIVGAGPGGSSCAYYLAVSGKNVLVLEKEKFPRRKICGDAVSRRAQVHLERMGIMKEIIAENKGRRAAVGGLVSPRGIRYVSDSTEATGGNLMIAIKREIMDAKMARAARRAGATLIEEYPVASAEFSGAEKLWTVRPGKKGLPEYRAQTLVAADGATSKLARSLGIIDGPPQAICSSVYIKAGTHRFDADGMVFYPPGLVPGYAAIFREADDDLVFCCYIILGGACTAKDLGKMHGDLLKKSPYITQALGPRAEIEAIKAAPLRLGGVPKSYGNHLLVVGDAAGHIDPLTGEGIQYAMDAGEMAAQTIIGAEKKNDFSDASLAEYQKKWMEAFGRDFIWSGRMVRMLARYPIFLDAFASLSLKKGAPFMARWAEIMTGSKSKLEFFLPGLMIPLLMTALQLGMTNRSAPGHSPPG